jgi:hypothetical protein
MCHLYTRDVTSKFLLHGKGSYPLFLRLIQKLEEARESNNDGFVNNLDSIFRFCHDTFVLILSQHETLMPYENEVCPILGFCTVIPVQPNTGTILYFQSFDPQKGYGREMIKQLHERYSFSILYPDQPRDSSIGFWSKVLPGYERYVQAAENGILIDQISSPKRRKATSKRVSSPVASSVTATMAAAPPAPSATTAAAAIASPPADILTTKNYDS